MIYIITKDIFMDSQDLEITKMEFQLLKESKSVLSAALLIEDIYEILISNYTEFEKEIMNLSVENLVRQKHLYTEAFEIRSILNRRMINLMASIRLYIDSVSHHISENFQTHISDDFIIKDLFKREYENNQYYRFMEMLRNYSQHYGLPIQHVTINTKRVENNDSYLIELSIHISSIKELLMKDKKTKKTVIEEFDGNIDLKTAIRNYIQSISLVHCEIREIISKPVNECILNIKRAQNKHKSKFKGNVDYIEAQQLSDESEIIDKVPLLLEWESMRQNLISRNKRLANLNKMYISGLLRN